MHFCLKSIWHSWLGAFLINKGRLIPLWTHHPSLSTESCYITCLCGPKLLWQLQLCSFYFNMAACCQRWALHSEDVYGAEQGVNAGKPEIMMAEVNKILFSRFRSQTQPQIWILTWVSWLIEEFQYPADCSLDRHKEEIDLKAETTREEENNIQWWFTSIFQREGLQHFEQADPRWRLGMGKWYKRHIRSIFHETVASSLFLGRAAWQLRAKSTQRRISGLKQRFDLP